MDEALRESILREKLQRIGADTFPDDEVQWRALYLRHSGPYSFVEAEAEPATVGYPRFVFVQHFDGLGRMKDCGCYVQAPNGWQLLCSNPDAPEGWKAIPLNQVLGI